ncbi:MAG: tRNA pseudouridine(38-40) synthase TruA [Bacilli bacterium]
MRYKCVVSYDGTNFHGFQRQKELRTVQLEIEEVLKLILKDIVKIHSAGRTDTGVHSHGQVFHFDTNISMPEKNMKNAINSRLPRDIYVKNVEIVSSDFHSRYSAKGKIYKYTIDLGEYDPLNTKYRYYFEHPLDIEKMIDASSIFIGEHDFRSFTKNHKLRNTVRTIFSIDFKIVDTKIDIYFYGNGFLHNMIRIIVAMLIEIGKGKINKEDLEFILKCEDRAKAPKIAPSNGLCLEKVLY